MKRILLILNLFLISGFLFGQLIKQDCYNTDNKKCKVKREIFKNSDGSYLLKEYYENGKVYIEAIQSKIEPEIKQGFYKYYDKKGNLIGKGNFSNGVPTGKWYSHYYNRFEKEVDYDSLAYKNCSYNEPKIGPNPQVDSEELPTFQGGDINTFRDYCQKELYYHPEILLNQIFGKVIVEFTVDIDGSICNIKAISSPNSLLSYEVKRVISQAPKWEPAKQNGVPVIIKFQFPIIFLLL
jgi:antitoxin component YwqK of YwqJK toxin-antitoxin module